MPKKMERRLKREAKKKGFSPARTRAYVYGTMQDKGWRPKPKTRASRRKR